MSEGLIPAAVATQFSYSQINGQMWRCLGDRLRENNCKVNKEARKNYGFIDSS